MPLPPALPAADQATAPSGADQEIPGQLASAPSWQPGMGPDGGQHGTLAVPGFAQLGEPSGRPSAPDSVVATAAAAVNTAGAASSGALQPAVQHQAQPQPGSSDHPGGDVQLADAQEQSRGATGGAAFTAAVRQPVGAQQAAGASPVELQQPTAATTPEDPPQATIASAEVDPAAQPGLEAQHRPAGQQEVATRESAFQQVSVTACSCGSLRLPGWRENCQSGLSLKAQPNTPLCPCHKHLAWLLPAADMHCQRHQPRQAWLGAGGFDLQSSCAPHTGHYHGLLRHSDLDCVPAHFALHNSPGLFLLLHLSNCHLPCSSGASATGTG